MTASRSAGAAVHGIRMASSPQSATPTGLTLYGCGCDEAALFRKLAAHSGVELTISEAPLTTAVIELARGNRCVSIDHKTPVSNEALRRLRNAGVAYLSTRSAGLNHIDVDFARSIGLRVEGVRYSPDSVADYTLMLILMTLRHARSIITRGEAHDFRLSAVRGRELRDLTVGVIGTGRIGAAVIARLRGFGCRVLAFDRTPKTRAEHVEIDELLRRSDVVTLHAPLDTQTHHLLDRERIALMKRDALIVNTGRGPLIETAALLDALESGRLGGAALDVVEGEGEIFYADRSSAPIDDELFLRLHRLPNVLITPHTAYYTEHALLDIVQNTLLNCLEFEGRHHA